MSSKFFSISTLAVAVFAFSAISFGQDVKTEAPKADQAGKGHHDGVRKGHRGGKFGRHMMRGMRGGFAALQLTDAQKEQLKAVREANKLDRSKFEAIRPLMQAKRAGTITADQQAQLDAFKKEMRANRLAMRQQMLAILTPEQKATLEQRKTEMKQRREEFRQKREEWRKQRELQKPAGTTPVKKDN